MVIFPAACGVQAPQYIVNSLQKYSSEAAGYIHRSASGSELSSSSSSSSTASALLSWHRSLHAPGLKTYKTLTPQPCDHFPLSKEVK